jgi:hypothetical protein
LPEGAVGGVARRFEVAAEGFAHLIPPLARLLLGGYGGGDCTGTDYSQQHILDGVVNSQTAEGDAVRGAIVHPGPAAAVVRMLCLAPVYFSVSLCRQRLQRISPVKRASIPPLPAYGSFMRIRHQRQPIGPRLAAALHADAIGALSMAAEPRQTLHSSTRKCCSDNRDPSVV